MSAENLRREKARVRWGKRLLQSDYLTVAMCAALVAIAAPSTPGFATAGNFANVITAAAPLLILALGQMLVMIGGGIDLSVTAILAIASVCGAQLISADGGLLHDGVWAIPGALVVMPVVGALFGGFNGVAVARLGMPPFIATLTSMMFLYGLATWQTQSENIGGLPHSFVSVGSRSYAALSVAGLLALGLSLGLKFTIYGRWLYAVGQNDRTARVSGVPVAGVVWATYVFSGCFAGVASIFYTAQLETGSPVLGENLLLDVIGAVVIGGTSLFGGRGKVSWTLGGVLFLALLDNVLNLQNLSHFAVMIAKGTLILLAALVDALRHRWSEA